MAAHTENFSTFGCFVETIAPFPSGTTVRLRIAHVGANFTGQGTVVYSRPNAGMGIAFTSIEPSSLPVLDLWLSNLRKQALEFRYWEELPQLPSQETKHIAPSVDPC